MCELDRTVHILTTLSDWWDDSIADLWYRALKGVSYVELAGSFLAFVNKADRGPAAVPPVQPARSPLTKCAAVRGPAGVLILTGRSCVAQERAVIGKRAIRSGRRRAKEPGEERQLSQVEDSA